MKQRLEQAAEAAAPSFSSPGYPDPGNQGLVDELRPEIQKFKGSHCPVRRRGTDTGSFRPPHRIDECISRKPINIHRRNGSARGALEKNTGSSGQGPGSLSSDILDPSESGPASESSSQSLDRVRLQEAILPVLQSLDTGAVLRPHPR